MLNLTPEKVVAILESARSPVPDPQLPEVLEEFRHKFLVIARKRFPDLGELAEDAAQEALRKVIEKIDQFRGEKKVEAKAHATLNSIRYERRVNRGRMYQGKGEEDLEN